MATHYGVPILYPDDAIVQCPHSWPREPNILLFGASGVAMTHLTTAIGDGQVKQGVRMRYVATTVLVQELQLARTRLRLEGALQRLDKYHVLILDGTILATSKRTSRRPRSKFDSLPIVTRRGA